MNITTVKVAAATSVIAGAAVGVLAVVDHPGERNPVTFHPVESPLFVGAWGAGGAVVGAMLGGLGGNAVRGAKVGAAHASGLLVGFWTGASATFAVHQLRN